MLKEYLLSDRLILVLIAFRGPGSGLQEKPDLVGTWSSSNYCKLFEERVWGLELQLQKPY